MNIKNYISLGIIMLGASISTTAHCFENDDKYSTNQTVINNSLLGSQPSQAQELLARVKGTGSKLLTNQNSSIISTTSDDDGAGLGYDEESKTRDGQIREEAIAKRKRKAALNNNKTSTTNPSKSASSKTQKQKNAGTSWIAYPVRTLIKALPLGVALCWYGSGTVSAPEPSSLAKFAQALPQNSGAASALWLLQLVSMYVFVQHACDMSLKLCHYLYKNSFIEELYKESKIPKPFPGIPFQIPFIQQGGGQNPLPLTWGAQSLKDQEETNKQAWKFRGMNFLKGAIRRTPAMIFTAAIDKHIARLFAATAATPYVPSIGSEVASYATSAYSQLASYSNSLAKWWSGK